MKLIRTIFSTIMIWLIAITVGILVIILGVIASTYLFISTIAILSIAVIAYLVSPLFAKATPFEIELDRLLIEAKKEDEK